MSMSVSVSVSVFVSVSVSVLQYACVRESVVSFRPFEKIQAYPQNGAAYLMLTWSNHVVV